MEDPANNKSEEKKQTKQNRNPSKNHIFRKRKPQKPEHDDCVIYINTKSPLKVFLDRCNKLINSGENELTIYCLGAAIPRGILVALKLCEEHVSFKTHTYTFTSTLLDDLEPATDDADYQIQRRLNSALKIRVFREDPLDSKPCSSQ